MRFPALMLLCLLPARAADTREKRVSAVVNTPGCVAFWDFVKREPDGARRFTAHVPAGQANDYPLDAANYIREYWGEGREATHADFPLLGRGPFGQAIRIRREEDAAFRPLLLVPRARLHDTPLDIKGAGKAVTVLVWAVRESGNHALAGIWHEGTDLKQATTTNIVKAVRGQRQYGLFAGLNHEGSACGHISENGAKSFGHLYAMHKSNGGHVSPAIPADAPAEVIDAGWEVFGLTFDDATDEITGWLNGMAADRWEADIRTRIPPVHRAWTQGRLQRQPGLQPGEDPEFPANQVYLPPEDKPESVKALRESETERVELHQFRYTRVKVTLRKGADGKWSEAERDLAEVRLNPWWYPHGIYTPANDGTGGPFTIGRVIHSARSVGFTGWIGGVAVFNRALTAAEIAHLSAVGTAASPIISP